MRRGKKRTERKGKEWRAEEERGGEGRSVLTTAVPACGDSVEGNQL